VSVSSVRVYLNGIEDQRAAVPPSNDTVRFRGHFDLATKRDGWVVVRVDGDKPLAPIVGDFVHFDVRPLAVTNPVLLDADGNGRYDAPITHGEHLTGIKAP
jgi:hypothetical protein